ncbi:MAG: HEPN domain-containing protein [Nanoarchaeota archaeon]|nr:HEPN domain-containing protein [Nanoarchaeota archaeon]
MKRSIKFYIKRELLIKDESVKRLANEYLTKAKNNLITLKILSEIQDNKAFRKKLDIPENYSTYEWIVITGYYAMYTAAISLLAKIGYRSKNHTATLCILEEFFVKKKILDQDILMLLKSAMFHKEEIEKLSDARHKREIAQYSITKQTTKTIAEKIKKDAYDFINKCEEIINKTEN